MIFDDLTFTEKKAVVKDLIDLGRDVRYVCTNEPFLTEDEMVAEIESYYEDYARELYDETKSNFSLPQLIFVDFDVFKERVLDTIEVYQDMFDEVGDYFVRQ